MLQMSNAHWIVIDTGTIQPKVQAGSWDKKHANHRKVVHFEMFSKQTEVQHIDLWEHFGRWIISWWKHSKSQVDHVTWRHHSPGNQRREKEAQVGLRIFTWRSRHDSEKHAIVYSNVPTFNIKIIYDDTDVFALLCYHYWNEGITTPMAMVSLIGSRITYCIRATVQNKSILVPKILALHALTGCDTVPATYVKRKLSAITAASKHWLVRIGRSQSSLLEIEWEATNFIVFSFGSKPCKSMTKCWQRMWGINTGKTTSSAPSFAYCQQQQKLSAWMC